MDVRHLLRHECWREDMLTMESGLPNAMDLSSAIGGSPAQLLQGRGIPMAVEMLDDRVRGEGLEIAHHIRDLRRMRS